VGGATLAGRLDGASTWRSTLAGALGLVALPLAALGLADAIAPALVLAFAAGGGMVVGEVLSETALPRLLDDAVLARAYGLALPAWLAGIVAGALVAGPLLATLGVTGTLMLAGSFVLAVAALLLRRPIRGADRRGRRLGRGYLLTLRRASPPIAGSRSIWVVAMMRPSIMY
jgi:predicted MFS family arabinose efflux permease